MDMGARARRLAVGLAAILGLAGAAHAADKPVAAPPAAAKAPVGKSGALAIRTLSSRPDMVSGGDALVEVRGAAKGVKLTLNGKDVSGDLRLDPASHTLRGLVGGLEVGKNTLSATAGAAKATLTLTDYPLAGPIVSGPHIMPYECRTEESGLGKALDADCSAAPRTDYFYRTTGGKFETLANPADRPADLAMTAVEGVSVPYVVRVESGTLNRSIYRIAMLADPRGWNHRLAVSFGGGAGAKYNQGTNTAKDPLSDLFLSRGFAHMVATELVNNLHGNAVLQGETLMMLKEHFIKTHGVPKWTVGFGGSGGAIQQLTITQMYPGLLDGLEPSLSFPDSTLHTADCGILQRYWKSDAGKGWSQEKKTAVEGFTPGTCRAWEASFVPVSNSGNKPGCDLKDKSLVWDKETNPKGARCALADWRVNIYGRDPKTGYARKTEDNEGLQYGLKGLNAGKLSVDEFLDLNEKIGGYDDDGGFADHRSHGDPIALHAAYASGLLNGGGGGLKTVPIIHYRTYNDPLGDIHSRERDMSIRARLIKANGDGDNEVFWVGPGATPGGPRNDPAVAKTYALMSSQTLDAMTKWLDALAADPTPLTHAKVVKHKPAEAKDAWFDASGVKHDEKATWDGPGGYNAAYPNHSEPRIQAGAPIANDVLKCRLKPIKAADYKVKFSSAQMARLKAIFPTGVCDFSKPGIGQVALKGTYQRY
ncbi:DUF6351 family protein [Phenylobacterium sp.]|uniref:DUF6351 family protein n=1 Tax=Phenylobacterium sp. TaxID=1871053 RepID=UPI002B624E07|nr:DUF6351 family protein [Phenylobacterium sp.]HLZ77353.1 DUF6351 family protein [Phenylobacterium sp.]